MICSCISGGQIFNCVPTAKNHVLCFYLQSLQLSKLRNCMERFFCLSATCIHAKRSTSAPTHRIRKNTCDYSSILSRPLYKQQLFQHNVNCPK